MSRPVRLALSAAALLLAPEVARAQFTPTLAVPRRRPPVVARDSSAGRGAAADTTPRVRLSDLKAWVDSVTQYAPGSLPAPGTAAPSSPVPPGPPPAPVAGPAPRTVSPVRPPSAPARPPASAPPATPAAAPPAARPTTSPR